MSTLVFNGSTHKIHLYDNDTTLIGSWVAYNNVIRAATLTHIPNGRYMSQDRSSPKHHVRDANGMYGLHGIVRFFVPGHEGIGVHSGRLHHPTNPGPRHPTKGCIRTTDEAMAVIVDHMRTSPITTVRVEHNCGTHSHSARRRTRPSRA
ncbi:L,D-transpeptidase family protein [Massilia aquatica]|uniref:L,D-transpeptidase family protein n=1 Tax=Massilia aquatica TaxID=2609000 RepID=UPI00351D7F94